jgi:hypothetical protein
MQTKFMPEQQGMMWTSPVATDHERITGSVPWPFYAGAAVLPFLATGAVMTARMELLLAAAVVTHAVTVRNPGGWMNPASRKGALTAAGVAVVASLGVNASAAVTNLPSAAVFLGIFVMAMACGAGAMRRMRGSIQVSGWLLAATMVAAMLYLRYPSQDSARTLAEFGLVSAGCMWAIAQRKPAPWLTPAGITEKALSGMPTRRRDVLRNTYSHRMSREEVATALNVSTPSVGDELRRGRAAVARALGAPRRVLWFRARRDETLISDFLDGAAEAEPVVQRLLRDARFKRTADGMFKAHELLQGHRFSTEPELTTRRGFRGFVTMLARLLGGVAVVAIAWLAVDAFLQDLEARTARAEGRAVSSDLWTRTTMSPDPGETLTVPMPRGPLTLYANTNVTSGNRFNPQEWRVRRATLDGELATTITEPRPWLVNTATAEIVLNRGSFHVTSIPGSGVTTIVVKAGRADVRHIGDAGAFVSVTGGQRAVVTDAVRMVGAK